MTDKKDIHIRDKQDDQVNLKELQIKLERIKSYVTKANSRVKANEVTLTRLREKIMDVENKRIEMSVVTKHKTEKKV